jgi:hypothetical protein
MQSYMDDLLNGRRDKFPGYFDGNSGLTGLADGLHALAAQGLAVNYERVHKPLGEGEFVLLVSEGTFGERSISCYDLYRIQWNDCQTLGRAGANSAARRLEECEWQILKK